MLAGDRGAVTAEFVILLPAVLLVLGFAIGAITLAAHRLTLTSAAAEVARLEARGDHAAAVARLSVLPHVQREQAENNGVLCVTLASRPGNSLLQFIEVRARGCAAVTH